MVKKVSNSARPSHHQICQTRRKLYNRRFFEKGKPRCDWKICREGYCHGKELILRTERRCHYCTCRVRHPDAFGYDDGSSTYDPDEWETDSTPDNYGNYHSHRKDGTFH